MPSARILLPFLLLLFFASAALARVDYEPLSDLESFHVLQQIERGETPEAAVLVRALWSKPQKLSIRAAELLGSVQVGSIDEWYALAPLIVLLQSDEGSPHKGATYPDPGMGTLRWWAHASLQRISGEDFGYRWDAERSDRYDAIHKWGAWGSQRSMALLLSHPDFELPPMTTKEAFLDRLRSQPGNDISWLAAFWERASISSVWEMGALGAVLLAAILLVGAPWLATDRRRFVLLFVLASTLGLSGYAYYDREYLAMLLRMRDVETVRVDCERLLKLSRTMGGNLMLPDDVARPKSFQALRTVQAYADDYTVALLCDVGTGSWPYYMYLYDPEGLLASVPSTFNRARPTLWKGIYLFHPSRH